ncbi:hypothetical protein HJC23_000542 [Cyclotella cryptica]|uniref:Uncharacterized protein n=1 Tax=Cyclotella cryptica TaxID=29204 RepID=A0ABD3PTP3_9STRA
MMGSRIRISIMIAGRWLKYALACSTLAVSAEGGTRGLRAARERNLYVGKTEPTESPTFYPTLNPTLSPVNYIEPAPTLSPTLNPIFSPTKPPLWNGDGHPTLSPTLSPTFSPSLSPTNAPIVPIAPQPTLNPTMSPILNPTKSPSGSPVWKGDSWKTDGHPTLNPTISPSLAPTFSPTFSPTINPTPSPIEPIQMDPTKSPSWNGKGQLDDGWKPDGYPTLFPTLSPTLSPTFSPTLNPTLSPSICGQNWHRSQSELNPNSCTNDNDLPGDDSKLYMTVQECCKSEFGKVAGCQVFNVCGPRTPGPASATTPRPNNRPTPRPTPKEEPVTPTRRQTNRPTTRLTSRPIPNIEPSPTLLPTVSTIIPTFSPTEGVTPTVSKEITSSPTLAAIRPYAHVKSEEVGSNDFQYGVYKKEVISSCDELLGETCTKTCVDITYVYNGNILLSETQGDEYKTSCDDA